MDVLIACEESQTVCKAFRARGHRAFSCDIQACSGGHPEWHIKGDCLPILNGKCEFVLENGQTDRQIDRWGLIIAHPPCTDLAASGARWFEQKRSDGRQRESIEFFAKFLDIDCDKTVIENPIGIISGNYIKEFFPDLAEKYGLPRPFDQVIHPWQFGDNEEKTTCLWLKGVRPLIPQITHIPKDVEFFEFTSKKTGRHKRVPKWYFEALHTHEQAKIRSKTFPGIANAMAEQFTQETEIQLCLF